MFPISPPYVITMELMNGVNRSDCVVQIIITSVHGYKCLEGGCFGQVGEFAICQSDPKLGYILNPLKTGIYCIVTKQHFAEMFKFLQF